MIRTVIKTAIISIVIIIVLLVLFVLFLRIFNCYILRVSDVNGLGGIVQLLFPPKDFFTPLVNEEIDITKKGEIKEFEFKNKYIGMHIAGIILDKFPKKLYTNYKKINFKLRLEIKYYTGNKLILNKIVNMKENKLSIFMSKVKGGFTFNSYKCPEELPIDEIIICKVKILEPDLNFNDTDKYGKVRFFIEKITDY